MTASFHAPPARAYPLGDAPDAAQQGPPKLPVAEAGGEPDLGPMSETKPWHRFETEAAVQAEDRIRAAGLRRSRPLPGRTTWLNMAPRLRLLEAMPWPTSLPQRDPADYERVLARLSLAGLPESAGPRTTSLASAVSMRTVRQRVIGAILAAFADLPDEALATATVINQRWVYTPTTLNGVTAAGVKARFRADLNRIGLTKVPGPFIAILHGEFEPRSGCYVLHFHILTTREKAELLSRLKANPGTKAFSGYTATHSGARPVVCKPVRDRGRQASYLLKAYWPARTIRRINGANKRDRKPRRIPEPYASQVLIWLDRQRLRDLVVMHDCWSLRRGGTPAMKQLYLSVLGQG